MARVIGLTGLIGTGKSTVARLLTRMHVHVHDADQCVHALYDDKSVRQMLLHHFPHARSWRTFDLDRTKLMNYIKKDPSKRALLNSLIHPLVHADQMAFLRKYRRTRIVILDVPLLFEAGMDALCDQVWVASCRTSLQKARVLRRTGFDEVKFKAIKSWQGDDRLKKRAADLVINTGARQSHIVRSLKKALRSLP
jgi:dephospho-CoA kinase